MTEKGVQSTEVAIIGAGLTGLVASFWLSRMGIDSVVLEKNGSTGGVIGTVRDNGFIYESGPNTGVISHPEVPELFDELAGICEPELADERARKRLIWKNGAWHPLPAGLASAIRTPLFTASDKAGILLEPFRKKGGDPLETLEKLVKRRLGKSFLDYAVDPFISGIYAGDPSYLVTFYALPKLYALEQKYGSFIAGAVRKMMEKKDEREKRVSKKVFSVKGGLRNLITALESGSLRGTILKNISGLSVNPNENGYKLTFGHNGNELSVEARYVISTAGPYEYVSLFPFVEKEELAILNNLEYASVIQVVMGFRKWEGIDLNAFGGLVPSRENRDILGILFPSSFLKNRAPEGGALLSVFLGGYRHPEIFSLSDNEILGIASRETGCMLQTGGSRPDLLRIFRYRHAIPQYGKSTKDRLDMINELELKYPRLILAGNIRGGIGMADRIRQGTQIARDISQVKPDRPG
jgi:protoporphyrinogen/coproporphyrinogen III oxidase